MDALINPWKQHGLEIAGWALMWTTVYIGVGGLGARLLKQTGTKTEADTKGRITGIVHALTACYLALSALLESDSPIHADHIYGASRATKLCLTVSSGFFLWDTLFVTINNEGLQFIAHGLACLFVYSCALFPFLHFYGCCFLLFELSTIFLNTRGIVYDIGLGDSTLYLVISVLFMLVFIAVRIVFGLYAVGTWLSELFSAFQAGSLHSVPIAVAYSICSITLMGLNIFWASIMIRKAYAMITIKPSKKSN
eukprot:m.249874 g.249874  ORF g.249874 m.249874 type:complete len:252 (-) comp16395_c0_seq1:247-1002(-)